MNTYKTTSLGVGETATVVINDIKEGKYGAVYVGTVDGEEAYIQPSGNLKFLDEKLSKGHLNLGEAFTITRTQDVRTKAGFTATQFAINDAKAAQGAPVAVANKVTSNNVADKLAAIRAKRGQSSANSSN